jgi:hypothetical protein
MFASQYYNAVPDITCCGKGMSGGYFPLSAMAHGDLLQPAAQLLAAAACVLAPRSRRRNSTAYWPTSRLRMSLNSPLTKSRFFSFASGLRRR